MKKWFLIVLCFLIGGGVAYTAINYSEYFPNGSQVVQSQLNGWTTPTGGASKDVETPEGCRKITSTQGIAMLIPTRTMAEWNAFKNALPSGVTVSSCVSPVNGVCGSANGATFQSVPTSNLCSVGTAGSVSGSGPWIWTCNGANGGSNASCSANIEPNLCGWEMVFPYDGGQGFMCEYAPYVDCDAVAGYSCTSATNGSAISPINGCHNVACSCSCS